MSLITLDALPQHYAVTLGSTMVISLEGEQADSYLQGQLTVNINKLDDKTVRHYAHCDNKGKTWSTGYIARFGSRILLLTNKDAGARTLAELNKYGVFSKVDIIDSSSELNALFVSDTLALDILGKHFPDVSFDEANSGAPLISYQSECGLCFKTDTTQQGFFAVLNQHASADVEANIAKNSVACFSQSVFDAITIANAHATVNGSTVGEYVPQMLNVHALNAIDFDKGCYMGQEVVARTRFLGKNKRAAFSFCINSNVDVAPGDAIEKQLGDNWRRAGLVTSVARLDNETHFMAVLSNDTTPEDLHRLADNEAITCYPYALPYSIEQQASNIIKKRR
jgi:folate-binding protein YgfZ